MPPTPSHTKIKLVPPSEHVCKCGNQSSIQFQTQHQRALTHLVRTTPHAARVAGRSGACEAGARVASVSVLLLGEPPAWSTAGRSEVAKAQASAREDEMQRMRGVCRAPVPPHILQLSTALEG